MSLSKYQIFLRTVECGSFTKAAESMSFTQSGVSHAVQSLEDELGVCLLSRSRGGVTLTADGRVLLPQIQRLCTEHHRLVQAAADLKGMESGLVKVASFSSVSAQWLPLILKSFGELYPNIEFEMLTGDYYDQIESWIVSGAAGGGFGDTAMTAMFIGLVSAYIGSYIGALVSGAGRFTFAGSWMPLAVVAVSAAVMAVMS